MMRCAAWLATLMLLAGCGGGPPSVPAPPPPQVGVAMPIVESVAVERSFHGRIEPIDHIELGARVSGTVRRVLVPGGSVVAEGQPLLELDPEPFRIAVQRAEAALAQARAALRQAEDARERMRRLFAEGKVAEQQRDDAERAAEAAAAALAAAESQLAHARLEASWTLLRAPFAGRIGLWSVSPGSQIIGGGMMPPTVLTTLTTIRPVYAAWDLDEPLFLALRERLLASAGGGAPVEVRVSLSGQQDAEHRGRVAFVDNHVDPGSGTVRVRALLDAELPPGAYARVVLAVAPPRPAVLVHERAIHAELTSRFVYAVDEAGQVRPWPVRVGARHGALVEVEGLPETQAVAVTDTARILRPGQAVRPRPIDMRTLAPRE